MERNMLADNTGERTVTINTFVYHLGRDSYFKLGFEDCFKDKPYNYDISDKRNAIHYARGRSFAIYTKTTKQPRAVWRKGILAKTAQERLARAAYYGWVL